jgi:hypothetical protein
MKKQINDTKFQEEFDKFQKELIRAWLEVFAIHS